MQVMLTHRCYDQAGTTAAHGLYQGFGAVVKEPHLLDPELMFPLVIVAFAGIGVTRLALLALEMHERPSGSVSRATRAPLLTHFQRMCDFPYFMTTLHLAPPND